MQSFCLLILRVQVLFSCVGQPHNVSFLFYSLVSQLNVLCLDFSGISPLNSCFSLALYGTYLLIYLLKISFYRPAQGLSTVIQLCNPMYYIWQTHLFCIHCSLGFFPCVLILNIFLSKWRGKEEWNNFKRIFQKTLNLQTSLPKSLNFSNCTSAGRVDVSSLMERQ